MCPDEELLRREREGDVQLLETPDPGGVHPPDWTLRDTAVKRFRRSAADFKLDIPDLVRPPRVLERVCGYLEEWVMERDRQGPDARYADVPSPPSLDVYQFIWDRTRMVRKDFILQNYVGTGGRCSASAVRCHERIARWHAMAEHQLSHLGDFVSQQSQQNVQELGQTMKTLNLYYDDSEGRATWEEEEEDRGGGEMTAAAASERHGCRHDAVMGGPGPVDFDGTPLRNDGSGSGSGGGGGGGGAAARIIGSRDGGGSGTAEPEMRGLYILLTMDNDGGMEVLKYAGRLYVQRPEIYASRPVQLALSIFRAKKDYNYARFFAVLRSADTPYLFGCVMFKYVEQMRKVALRIMAKTFGARRKDTGENMYDSYELSDLVRLLCYEDADEAREACRHYSVTVKEVPLVPPVAGGDDGRGGGVVVEKVYWRQTDFKEKRDPTKGHVIPLRPRKMIRTIEAKLNGATRLAVCRGEVSGAGATLTNPPMVGRRTTNVVQQQVTEEEKARVAARLQQQREEAAKRAEAERKKAEVARLALEREREEERKRVQAQEREKQRQLALKRAEEERMRKLQREAEEKKRKQEEERARAFRIQQEREAAERAEAERKKAEAARLALERKREAERKRAEAEERERQRQLALKRAEEERRRKLQQEADEKKRREEEERRRREAEARRLREEEEERIRKAKKQEEERIAREWERKLNHARKMLVWRRWRKRVLARQYAVRQTHRTLEGMDPTFSSPLSLECRGNVRSIVPYGGSNESEHNARDIFYRLGTLTCRRINLSSMVGDKLVEVTKAQRTTELATVPNFLPECSSNRTVLLCKVAVILPRADGDDDGLCETVHTWINSRLTFGKLATDNTYDHGQHFEVRSVAVEDRINQDASQGSDVALFVIPPLCTEFPYTTPRDAFISVLSAHASKLTRSAIPHVILNLDDGSDAGYSQFVRELITISNRSANMVGEIVAEWTTDGLDTSLNLCCYSLCEAFVHSSVVEGGPFSLQRVSLSFLGRACLRNALWESENDYATESLKSTEKKLLNLLRLTLKSLVLELEGAQTRMKSGPLAVWPSVEFASISDESVPDYLPDGTGLPLNWLSLLDVRKVEEILSGCFRALFAASSARAVVEDMVSDAPSDVKEECEAMLWNTQFRHSIESALEWQERVEEAIPPTPASQGIIYLPRADVPRLIELTLKRVCDAESIEQREVSAERFDLSMENGHHLSRKVKDSDWKASQWQPGVISRGKRSPTEKDTPELSRRVKRHRPLGRPKGSSIDQKESKDFSAALEDLFHGETTVDLMVGDFALSDILGHTPSIDTLK